MKASKIAYRPVGLVLGAVSGMIAGAAFKQTWKLIEGRPWRQILLAAAVQGAIFSVVKAAVERSGAQVTRRFTGTWPA